MKNTLLFLGLIILLVAKSEAQPYTIKRLGVEDGLSSNYVVGITQDKQGCMWFATEGGLNKFDGRQFTVYKKYTSKLSANELNCVCADPRDNKVWIGTQREGLCVFDCDADTFTVYRAGDGTIATNDITNIIPSFDKKGLWITTYHVGIHYYDIETGKFTHYYEHNVKGLGGLKNYIACDDGRGNLYVGHDGKGMSVISLKDHTIKRYQHVSDDPDSLPGGLVVALCVDEQRNIWVGTNKGLSIFNPATEKFTTFRHIPGDENSLLSNQVLDIKQMRDGRLWICTNMGGVSILDMQQNAFTSPTHIHFQNIPATNDVHGLSGPNARCAFQDSFGNIWLGNYRGGVDFISYAQPIFNMLPYTVERDGKQSGKQVWGLFAKDDKVLVGGEGEFAVFQKNKLIDTFLLRSYQTQSNTHINIIYKDSQDRLWMGTYLNGILLYDPQNKKMTRIGKTSHEETLNVHCFYEDKNGSIWVGTESGLYIYENGKLEMAGFIQSQLPDTKVHGILRDKEDKLWIGTFGKGVSVFDPNNKLIYNFVVENGFCSNAVNHMMQDSRQRILVATREGVAIFHDTANPDEYEVFKERNGLKNSQVRAITEDKLHQIWISTNGGVSRLDEAKKVFYNYSHHDGVPMGDFMNGSTCMTSDGTMYFGSQNGACYFNPKDIPTNREVSSIVITRFCTYHRMKESHDEELPMPIADGEINLPYNQNTFKISFNVLDYTQSPQVEFTYMLEGLEKAWYNTQGENQVTFRNISPGTYVFKVKTRIRNQEWDEKEASLVIHIQPPFWLTWYAKLVYVLLFVLALYGLLHFYKHKIDLESSLDLERRKSQNDLELNNERLRFYTNITHELRTPLTLILGPLEDLLSDGTLSPKHANKISIIHDSATRLLNLINRILEFRKTETQNRKLAVARGNLAQLVQEIGLRYKELNPNNKVAYHIHIETEDAELFYDADMVTIILDNLLSNAVKYTSEGEITLTLRSVEEMQIKYTEISVKDTGHGIEPEALPHIFDRYYQAKSKFQASGSGIGLALVKGLTDLHEGMLKVESTPEVGTTFILRLLTENTYPNAIHVESKVKKLPIPTEDMGGMDPALDGCPIVLVVEDNSDIREYIKSSFADIYEVITAKDGQEGWELTQARIPNVIVSDIMMPIMDGVELCKKVKEDMRTSHIPVILLTAKDSLHDKEEGYASGADAYLTKPFSAKLLHSCINNLLETRKKIASQLLLADVKPAQEQAVSSLNRLDNEFMQKITQIIEENIEMEKMDVAFIADKMCMSHSTLYRKIKGLADMSANEFIRKVKMRKSVEMLISGEYTISEISYMTGFSSVAYFRQCFKNEYGVSPSGYVKQKQ